MGVQSRSTGFAYHGFGTLACFANAPEVGAIAASAKTIPIKQAFTRAGFLQQSPALSIRRLRYLGIPDEGFQPA